MTPHPDDQAVSDFLDTICQKRGGESWFKRFATDEVYSGGLRLHLDINKADPINPVVVFMPGTNAYAMIYGEFLAALADHGYNIVGFDPRGHGRSDGARGSYTIPELLADFRAALRYTREHFSGPVFLAGSSQGGICAFYLAAEGYPVAGAICHNLADLGDPASVQLTRFPKFSALMKPMALLLARFLPEWNVPMAWYINLAREPIRGLGSSVDMIRQGVLLTPYIRLRGMASLGTEPLPAPVEEIRTPVLLLHGEKDVIFPQAYVESIYRRLTCPKEFVLCPGAHHYVLFDEVPQLIGPVVEWMRTITSKAGDGA